MSDNLLQIDSFRKETPQETGKNALEDIMEKMNELQNEEEHITKKRRDLLEVFEVMYQRLGGQINIENPFKDILPGDDITKLWEKIPNNKMLGILHGYVLLRSIIKAAIEKEEQSLIDCEAEKIENESIKINDLALKVEYLNNVMSSVVGRINSNLK